MNSPLVIVGGGGFGREIAWAVESSALPWSIAGFLDDGMLNERTVEGWPRLGLVKDATRGMKCVVAVGNPRVRRQLARQVMESGAEFVTVDSTPHRHASVSVASGGMLVAGVRTTVNTTIGAHFIGNLNCTVGHDVRIGEFVTIAPLAAVSGNVRIGDGAEIGTGAVVREGVRVGSGALVGMGAVVVANVEPNTVVVGNPARVLKVLSPW